MKRALVVFVACTALWTAAGAGAQEAPAPAGSAPPPPAAPPAEMLKVVFHSEMPKLDPKSPDAQRKTLYRAGERWGRMEHPRNPSTGQQPLVIVASPDAWFVDLNAKTAEHFRDPGPTYRFRAVIVQARRGLPKSLESLEFGREFEFLDAHAAKRRRLTSETGEEADVYETTLDGVTVHVSTPPDRRAVRTVVVTQDRQILAVYRYDEYRTGLPTDPSLFAPPQGVRVSEQEKRAPPQSSPSR